MGELEDYYMDHSRKLKSIIQTVILSVFLIIYLLLSLNSLLPLEWQFPSWRLSPHLEERTENTSSGTRTDYVNAKGVITVALDKNFATVIQTLDQDGNCVLKQFLDDQGKPISILSGNSAVQTEYSSDGQWTCSTYLDDKLNPMLGKNGYASMRMEYNENGQPETETYYDVDGQPTVNSYKNYGVRYEYDEDNRLSVVTNIDSAGDPMLNIEHYAICRKAYNSDGGLYMEMFYDADGNPAKLSNGEFGYIYENGRKICIDQKGRKTFILRHLLLHSIFAVAAIGASFMLLILFSDRALASLLLLLYIGIIAFMTILGREAGSGIVIRSIPPNIYLFFANREILYNTWLFIPLGALLYKLSHKWGIVVLPIVLSLFIEIIQLVFDIGAFQFSDLIANILGGIVGIVVCCLFEPVANWIRNAIGLGQRDRRPGEAN